MNLSNWLQHSNTCAEDGLCVCLSTDGLDAKSQVIAVGMMSNITPYTCIMIKGGNPERTEKHTGITYEMYMESAIDPVRARVAIANILQQHRFVVIKDTPFFEYFIASHALEPFEEYIPFDVVKYLRFLDKGNNLLGYYNQSMYDLVEYIDSELDEPYAKGYGFVNVFQKNTGMLDEQIAGETILERRTKQLYYLYNTILVR
jgi:hypothetical protein